jgi:hypothetical protein
LIDLVLAQVEQNAKLQAEFDVAPAAYHAVFRIPNDCLFAAFVRAEDICGAVFDIEPTTVTQFWGETYIGYCVCILLPGLTSNLKTVYSNSNVRGWNFCKSCNILGRAGFITARVT